MPIQALAVRRFDERQKFAEDLQFRARSRHVGRVPDRADAGHRHVAIGAGEKAQIDLGFGRRRHRVDRLAAAHQADVDRDAARNIGQRMQRRDLSRELLDRADALLEIGAGMRGLAGHGKLHEHPAFAARDDGAARSPRLGVEHRAGPARLRLDQAA